MGSLFRSLLPYSKEVSFFYQYCRIDQVFRITYIILLSYNLVEIRIPKNGIVISTRLVVLVLYYLQPLFNMNL